MAYKLKSSGLPFKELGSSPAKQQAKESETKSKSQIEYEKEMYPTGKKPPKSQKKTESSSKEKKLPTFRKGDE
jgi:hypothetical protein